MKTLESLLSANKLTRAIFIVGWTLWCLAIVLLFFAILANLFGFTGQVIAVVMLTVFLIVGLVRL